MRKTHFAKGLIVILMIICLSVNFELFGGMEDQNTSLPGPESATGGTYYKSTYSFKEGLTGWETWGTSSTNQIWEYHDFWEHEDTICLHSENSSSGTFGIKHLLGETNYTAGFVELYVMASAAGVPYFNFVTDQSTYYISLTPTEIFAAYSDGSGWHNIIRSVSLNIRNSFNRYRFEWNYTNGEILVYENDILKTTLPEESGTTQLSEFWIYTVGSSTGAWVDIDAVSFSWDSNYHKGDLQYAEPSYSTEYEYQSFTFRDDIYASVPSSISTFGTQSPSKTVTVQDYDDDHKAVQIHHNDAESSYGIKYDFANTLSDGLIDFWFTTDSTAAPVIGLLTDTYTHYIYFYDSKITVVPYGGSSGSETIDVNWDFRTEWTHIWIEWDCDAERMAIYQGNSEKTLIGTLHLEPGTSYVHEFWAFQYADSGERDFYLDSLSILGLKSSATTDSMYIFDDDHDGLTNVEEANNAYYKSTYSFKEGLTGWETWGTSSTNQIWEYHDFWEHEDTICLHSENSSSGTFGIKHFLGETNYTAGFVELYVMASAAGVPYFNFVTDQSTYYISLTPTEIFAAYSDGSGWHNIIRNVSLNIRNSFNRYRFEWNYTNGEILVYENDILKTTLPEESGTTQLSEFWIYTVGSSTEAWVDIDAVSFSWDSSYQKGDLQYAEPSYSAEYEYQSFTFRDDTYASVPSSISTFGTQSPSKTVTVQDYDDDHKAVQIHHNNAESSYGIKYDFANTLSDGLIDFWFTTDSTAAPVISLLTDTYTHYIYFYDSQITVVPYGGSSGSETIDVNWDFRTEWTHIWIEWDCDAERMAIYHGNSEKTLIGTLHMEPGTSYVHEFWAFQYADSGEKDFYLDSLSILGLKSSATTDSMYIFDDDHDGLTNVEEIDSDSDGLNDVIEFSTSNGYVTDPFDADSDDDGLSDYEEIMVYNSHPNNAASPSWNIGYFNHDTVYTNPSGWDVSEGYTCNVDVISAPTWWNSSSGNNVVRLQDESNVLSSPSIKKDVDLSGNSMNYFSFEVGMDYMNLYKGRIEIGDTLELYLDQGNFNLRSIEYSSLLEFHFELITILTGLSINQMYRIELTIQSYEREYYLPNLCYYYPCEINLWLDGELVIEAKNTYTSDAINSNDLQIRFWGDRVTGCETGIHNMYVDNVRAENCYVEQYTDPELQGIWIPIVQYRLYAPIQGGYNALGEPSYQRIVYAETTTVTQKFSVSIGGSYKETASGKIGVTMDSSVIITNYETNIATIDSGDKLCGYKFKADISEKRIRLLNSIDTHLFYKVYFNRSAYNNIQSEFGLNLTNFIDHFNQTLPNGLNTQISELPNPMNSIPSELEYCHDVKTKDDEMIFGTDLSGLDNAPEYFERNSQNNINIELSIGPFSFSYVSSVDITYKYDVDIQMYDLDATYTIGIFDYQNHQNVAYWFKYVD